MVTDWIRERYLDAFGIKKMGMIFGYTLGFLNLPNIIQVEIRV